MLTSETKKHIDNARQILVGKVPDPKQQIDQITNALIYKFMEDMDEKSRTAGGKASFFVKDLEEYAWRKLMDPKKGSQDRLNLYTMALEKFSTSPQLPQLFRDIFRQAFLPYRDPETLNLFLKEIEFFDYSHSEELGNAFEYLLSIMGSQGDAGQFRTPRHIIDFMVEIIDPNKNDTILDPACGTAGFLISAYKHIVNNHEDLDENGKKNNEKQLTHPEKQKLMSNLEGYDISSDMVKLARVNMYLHGNNQPKIYEYDSLSSEEHWGETFDVIMANPPFMSPKGGIRPHNKFGVESSRAEVLFVDYIMSHLNQKGRAGIIVPEGVIFQSGKAYKKLRKALVEDGLLAVISLPSGVFNPYAGVKTSILIFDNDRAKKSENIVFAQVKHDGFDLGAQRRPSKEDDLPAVAKVLKGYRQGQFATQEQIDEFLENEAALRNPGSFSEVIDIKLVERSKIAESGDHNLSASRYTVREARQHQKWPMVQLNDVVSVLNGSGFPIDYQGDQDEKIPFLKVSDMNLPGNEVFINKANNYISHSVLNKLKAKTAPEGSIIFPKIGAAIATNKKRILKQESAYDNNVMGLIPSDKINGIYLYFLLKNFNLSNWASDSALPSIRKSDVEKQLIPLPPVEVQKQIVEELDRYQKIINGARQVVANYKPKINIDPSWPIKPLDEILEYEQPTKYIVESTDYNNNYRTPVLTAGKTFILGYTNEKSGIFHENLPVIIFDDFTTATKLVNFPFKVKSSAMKILRSKKSNDVRFIYHAMQAIEFDPVEHKRFWISQYSKFKIAVAPIKVQRQIADEIELEQKIINANKKLIDQYEQKIEDVIDEIWGE